MSRPARNYFVSRISERPTDRWGLNGAITAEGTTAPPSPWQPRHLGSGRTGGLRSSTSFNSTQILPNTQKLRPRKVAHIISRKIHREGWTQVPGYMDRVSKQIINWL